MSISVRAVVLAACLVWAQLASDAKPARAETPVDLELVLTVDVSLSMDLDEQRLQREGYVAAFRDPQIWEAIRTGGTGSIAVAYVEWAGPGTQNIVVPWTLIDGEQTARAFADTLEQKPISRARLTSISSALRFAERLLAQNEFRGRRKVVDVSGDGPNNSGAPVEPVRDALVEAGIVINGLPIILKPSGGWNTAFDLTNLDAYYAACVIGGPGSFSIPVREKGEFLTAIRRKLILEIAGLTPEQPARRAGMRSGLVRAQMLPPPGGPSPGTGNVDCMAGEKLWQRYYRDP